VTGSPDVSDVLVLDTGALLAVERRDRVLRGRSL